MTDAEADALLVRIVAFNDAWHALRDLSPSPDASEPDLSVLRDLKAVLQARLLRMGAATLMMDPNPTLGEPCWSVKLTPPRAGRVDACHLPVRIARQVLTPLELQAFGDAPDER